MDFKINLSTRIAPSAGKILISEPFLKDSFFKRTVILLCKHSNQEGSFGLVLNRFLEVEMNEVVHDFPAFGGQIGLGGPVDADSLFYIHTQGDLIPNSMQILDNLYLGGDYETIIELLNQGQLTKDDIRFFIGYSGWGKNQLADELKTKSWLVAHTTTADVMNADQSNFWEQALKDLGSDFKMLANFPEDPSLN